MPHVAPDHHAHALQPHALSRRCIKEQRHQKRQSHTRTGQGKMRAREEGQPEQEGIQERAKQRLLLGACQMQRVDHRVAIGRTNEPEGNGKGRQNKPRR